MAVAAHAIRSKRLKYCGTDFVPCRDVGEGHRVGRSKQSVEVVVKGKNPVGINPKALPDRVTPLNGGIEYAHFCLVAGPEAVADPNLQVSVLGIERLKHLKRI